MERLEHYIEEHSSVGKKEENILLDQLERETNLKVIQPKMVSGRVQGAFLTLITKMLRPQRVLEIGTFTGYSALSIAAGLDEGAEIHTVEIDDELEDLARSFFERSEHGHKIHLHIGSALELVPELITPKSSMLKPPSQSTPKSSKQSTPKPSPQSSPKSPTQQQSTPEPSHLQSSQTDSNPMIFDLIFIDGDKREYPDYYRMLMGDGGGPKMVKPGTIILTDNVLWYGKVAEPETLKQADRMSHGIMEFNRMVAADPRVENVILPLRDGINLIRVK
jgi:predicted O-methyltransferase YrrM